MLKRLFFSVRHAVRGVWFALKTEYNMRWHFLFALAIMVAAHVFHFSAGEVGVVIILIVLVIGLELVNTAIEYLIDIVHPRLHQHVSIVKDLMAGAVLVAALGAATVAVIILWQHCIIFLK